MPVGAGVGRMGAAGQGAAAHLADRCRGVQQVAKIAMGQACVFAHQRFGAVALALFDGGDHFAMLFLRQGQDDPRIGSAGLRHDQAIRRGERQLHHARQCTLKHIAAGHRHQQGMEARVGLHIGGKVDALAWRADDGVDLGQQRACLGQLRGGYAALGSDACGQVFERAAQSDACGQAFERAAQFDRIVHIALAEGLHRIPTARQGAGQAFFAQPLQRRAHRRARHAQALHHGQLGQPRSGGQGAVEDQFAQCEQRAGGLPGAAVERSGRGHADLLRNALIPPCAATGPVRAARARSCGRSPAAPTCRRHRR